MIKLSDIKKTYRSGALVKTENEVLKGISLDLSLGECVGIIGDSGCGKSTLAKVIAGMIPADSGTIELDGTEINYPYTKETRRQIQLIFQHPDVAMPPKLKIENSFKEVYKLLGKPYDTDKLLKYLEPYGIYEEHIGRYPASLSGGELQRLCIARILLLEPKFIMLDEPTSMLDTISQGQIIRMLKDILSDRDVGFMFITHDLSLAEVICDRIFKMENGVLIQIQ